ncbi:hypothetical protein EDB89DRAFT_1900924 [Lactarius sanguifluus]|nr:hypothetical protein EDB89DRAFT_1900924 [Lactarius sanguifluus]
MVSKAKEVMFGAPTITRMTSRIHHINSNRGRHFPRSKQARQRPCLEPQILILCAPCLVANAPSVVSRVSNPASALSEHPLTIRRTSTGPSAASSVTVKVEEGGEDDIPVSIRNSFRELRSVKEELECQRSENERLRADLAASQKSAADTLTRLDNVKQMTKKSIQTTSNELAELHAGLVSLKAQSNESFAFAAQARSALPDISDLRSAIKDTSQSLDTFLSHRVIRSLIPIQNFSTSRKTSPARKANDFLRDKLTDFTSQYAEAMERVQTVERVHTSQTNALRIALDDLHNTNLLVAARTDKLEATQKELSGALIACALADENAAQLEKRAEKLALEVEEKALITTTLQRENAGLQALLKDKASSIGPLLSLKDESVSTTNKWAQGAEVLMPNRVLEMVSSSRDQRSELATLRKTLEEQLQIIGKLNGRQVAHWCHILEHEIGMRKQELANKTSENATVRAERDASHERENSLNRTIERLGAELSVKEARSKVLQDQIQVSTEERKREHDQMIELQMRCQALQVRFEDQSASLKLARESHGDMQVKLDAETGKLRQEVLVLQERNCILQRSVDDCRRQLENQQESSMVTRNEYEKKLKDERDGSHSHIQVLQGRMLQADLDKTQAIREMDDLRNSLATAQGELLISREQAQNVQASLSAWGAQVKDLTTQNHALQAEKVLLLERGHNINTRYETNDLSVEEKAFVNRLLDESRTFHEKRILDKQNELRRRDNQITEQEARIKSLEKGLARYLKSQDPKFTPRNDAQSILNLSKFASSSSPPEPIVAGADADKRGGACTSPQDQNTHLLEASLEFLKDDHEVVLLSPKLTRDSPEDAETPLSNAPRAVKLGKHGRPHSQTSQEESGNINDVTRPPRRLCSSRNLLGSQALKPLNSVPSLNNPNPGPASGSEKTSLFFGEPNIAGLSLVTNSHVRSGRDVACCSPGLHIDFWVIGGCNILLDVCNDRTTHCDFVWLICRVERQTSSPKRV